MMGMTRFMLVQLRLRLLVPCDPQAHFRTKGRRVHVSNASRCPAYSVLLRLKKMSYPRPMKRPGTVVDVSKNKAALAVSNEEGWTVVEPIGSEGKGVLGTSERKVRLSHRQRLLRRCTSYSWSAIGLRNGRSSPRATVSGIANEYRPNMLMWSWISGESLATSASQTWCPSRRN